MSHSKQSFAKKKKSIDKYALYEESVQSAEHDTDWCAAVYRQVNHKEARALREDFCGTFNIACEWVRRDKKNTAVCLDLDPEPLAYGKKTHLAKLSADQKRRMKILRQNVLSVTKPAADLVIAYNFSFFIFKKRQELVKYFDCVRRSLTKRGIVVLELAGGAGMMEKIKERRTIKEMRKPKFTYFWDQKYFDPITHDGKYAIHFKLKDGRQLKNAFTYDWRVWSIPELRDALADAGFSESWVYWESEDEEYVRAEKGTNDWSWIAYVVGIK